MARGRRARGRIAGAEEPLPLSPGQERARSDIHAALSDGRPASVLAGPAGTGKTTLIRTVCEDVEAKRRRVVLLAPTGAAAKVLRDKSGRHTSTIHRALFREVAEDKNGDPVFGTPGWPCEPGDLVVVDEGYMVGQWLYGKLMSNLPPGAQVLFAGDDEQLPPVDDDTGPDFDAPTARLTEVHRTALESPILRLATAIRTADAGWTWGEVGDGAFGEPGCVRRRAYPEAAAKWTAAHRNAGEDVFLLTWRNKTRRELNSRTRERRGILGKAPAEGDVLMCLRNNYHYDAMNGETFQVRKAVRIPDAPWPVVAVTLWEDGRVAFVREDLVGCENKDWSDFERTLRWKHRDGDGDPVARWLYVDIGECRTVHKSQGGEARRVGFFADRGMRWFAGQEPDDYRRMCYTAVTRAREEFVLFEAP